MLSRMRSLAARMSSSEIMNTHLSANAQYFELYPLRFRFVARTAIHFRAGETANMLRGQFGKALYRRAPDAYARFFAPAAADGPSGLRDVPRAFVFRVAHLDGAEFSPGEVFEIGINLFEVREPPIEIFREALVTSVRAKLVSVEGSQILRLPLTPGPPVERVRVIFSTATELKGADRPEFGVLFARIRDRVSTLRARFGAGPLAIDFKRMGERACQIRITRCELQRVQVERSSRSTGQTHPLGGFTGIAEYEGNLAEFVPYLEVARWTGVGRQTVWGKGEIEISAASMRRETVSSAEHR